MDIGYEQSKKHGPQARQFVVLFDMAGFNVKQYTWRPAAEVVISLIKNYEANYPEILKCCYIINGKFSFQFYVQIENKVMTIPKIFHFCLYFCCSSESICDCIQYSETLSGRIHIKQNYDIQT